MIVFIIISMLTGSNSKAAQINPKDISLNPVKAAVVVYDTKGAYISQVIENLKDIQKKNEGKVEFTFFSSDKKQATQNRILNTILQNKEYKLLLVELVDLNAPQEVIDKAKENNLPVILLSREPPNKDAIKSYDKAIFIGSVLEQGGELEGQIIVDEWKKNKTYIDRNKDNKMQYIIFKGPKDNLEAVARTKYSVQKIKDAGINIEEIAAEYFDWSTKEEAKKLMQLLFLQYGNKIEAIIATNDNMAIGAIETLQAAGYNNGNKERTITVVGVDAIPEAREFIKKGFMTGTVVQDAHAMAEAAYIIGMNLVQEKNPIEGTKYKFDDSAAIIRIPYKTYIPNQ